VPKKRQRIKFFASSLANKLKIRRRRPRHYRLKLVQ
jgi:hypothetical protein